MSNAYAARPLRLPNPKPALQYPELGTAISLYYKLQLLRQFEACAHALFLRGLVKGTTHLSIGMEAIAAGFAEALRSDDYTFATYRGHAHTLARGASAEGVMAELLGRSNGLLGGKGGSMHLTSVEHGVMGSYAIIGAHLPVACGAAWSAQLRSSGQVAVCFFGDGTTNIGGFHEALNLAAVWNLPVVFVCENNLYMEYTPIDLVTSVPNPAADRASAYGLESIVVDGNDADAVFDVATSSVDRCRSGAGPVLVEALTYRHGGHSRADAGKYRPEEEVAAWKAHDPIPLYHRRLIERGVQETELANIERLVASTVSDASEAAQNGAVPEAAALLANVWADGTSDWRTS
jgi:pyruvate dehydrogenase E1 component alpha subunit